MIQILILEVRNKIDKNSTSNNNNINSNNNENK